MAGPKVVLVMVLQKIMVILIKVTNPEAKEMQAALMVTPTVMVINQVVKWQAVH